MTCDTCKHAKRIGAVLCCLNPKEPDRPGYGPRAAVVVHRNRCGGKGWEKR